MRCPKCNKEQNGTVECEVCGVIFDKFHAAQKRKLEATQAQPKIAVEQNHNIEEQSSSVQKTVAETSDQPQVVLKISGTGLKIFQAFVLAIIVAGTTYYFTVVRNGSKSVEEPQKQPATKGQQTPVVPQSKISPENLQLIKKKLEESATTASKRDEVRYNLKPAESPHDNLAKKNAEISSEIGSSGNIEKPVLDRVKKATVTVSTPWGTGSGFFLSQKYIVTNRHVVHFDDKVKAELRQKLEKRRQYLDLDYARIKELQDKIRKLENGPTRTKLQLIIEDTEESLKKGEAEYNEGAQKLAAMDRKVKSSEIKIIFSDGKSLLANSVIESKSLDLALISLYISDRPVLERSLQSKALREGDTVFAIGTPRGLSSTITSGVVSAFRKLEKDGPEYIQTSAAINPGNSGGPLIDAHGYVYGVITLVGRDMQGVGFAIPIERVYEEFGSLLH